MYLLQLPPTNLNATFFFFCVFFIAVSREDKVTYWNLFFSGLKNLWLVQIKWGKFDLFPLLSFSFSLLFVIPRTFFFLTVSHRWICSRTHLPEVQKPKAPLTNWSEHVKALGTPSSVTKHLSSSFLYALESQKPRGCRDMAARYHLYYLLHTTKGFIGI